MECYVCGGEMKFFMEKFNLKFWRCNSCGLERIYPQPRDDILKEIYGKEYFEKGWGFSEQNEELIRKMKKMTFLRYLREIDVGKVRKVLDCGAGLGYMLELAKELGWEPYAVEISPFGADICRKIVGDKNVFQGEIEDINFSGFDLITMIDFIEHLKDPFSALKKARESILDDGYLLITTPRVDGIIRKIMGKYWFHYNVEHLWYFSLRSLKILLEMAGFRVIKVKPAVKSIALDYAYHQLTKYRVPFISELFELVKFIGKLKNIQVPVVIGDMLVVSSPC